MDDVTQFNGKVAFITGSASGIGRATVARFLASGAKVVACDNDATRYNVDDATSENTLNLIFDVRQPEAWQDAVGQALKVFGGIDVLVNCAGVNYPQKRRESEQNEGAGSLAEMREVMAVNLEGTLLGCEASLPSLCERRGSVVNVSSIAGWVGVPAALSYGASKAAVWQATKSIALDVVQSGVRVNVVHPGRIDTPMYKPMTGNNLSDIPLGRLGQPHEVAEAIQFLASESASYITGTALIVDGGLTLI